MKEHGNGAKKGLFISKQKKAKAGTLLLWEGEKVANQMGLEVKEIDVRGQTFYLAPLYKFVDMEPLKA